MVTGHARQVVFLQSNNCIRICLGGLGMGRLTEVAIRTSLTVMLYVIGK